MQKPKEIFLDVRTMNEYDSGHIPDTIHIPLDELNEKALAALPDKHTHIIVYCRSGIRSAKAKSLLQSLGYTNITNFGSIQNWEGKIEF